MAPVEVWYEIELLTRDKLWKKWTWNDTARTPNEARELLATKRDKVPDRQWKAVRVQKEELGW